MRTPPEAFAARRARLAARLGGAPALVCAGRPSARNFPANRYPFRASSHFLWLVGDASPGAALLFDEGRATLFVEPAAPDAALWHGQQPSPEPLGRALGLEVRPLAALDDALASRRDLVATLAPIDPATAAELQLRLRRPIATAETARVAGPDATLADAMVELRLVHDDWAVDQLRQAAAVTVEAHLAGLRATRPGATEAEVAAAMEHAIARHAMTTSYASIVTVHGEVLHQERRDGTVAAGDLLLADVGAETQEGWAGDVTRVWPAASRFSPTQRAIYDVVLEAQRAAIAAVRPGTRYRTVHETAAHAIVAGLHALGIFRATSSVADLAARGAHALFFPHGIGHLLGLDVHDMEDLGDRAGYAPGRERPSRFGDAYLRLDRDLAPGMCVTIEPGFYQVPAILDDPARVGPFADDLDRGELAKFADVRGIRIEDDVLVGAHGAVVLTAAMPKTPDEIERLVAERPQAATPLGARTRAPGHDL